MRLPGRSLDQDGPRPDLAILGIDWKSQDGIADKCSLHARHSLELDTRWAVRVTKGRLGPGSQHSTLTTHTSRQVILIDRMETEPTQAYVISGHLVIPFPNKGH
ncbi:hypothetical protein RRG08_023714 [Elysia crispata]|uniref:Uncharacterized protein n=1 Tax=Elysia crispata TaxID=231223 RepID=A0AAE1DB67_9GAST|nr:hypothetical protein RRG08_023714 [Elysia crispata]